MFNAPAGGRTVFPLCGSPPTSPDRVERHRGFQAGLESMFGGAERGFHRHVDFDVHSAHPFNSLLEEACRGHYGFSMAPRKGTKPPPPFSPTPSPFQWPCKSGHIPPRLHTGAALLFDSMLPSGEYNPWTWHAGCNVVQVSTMAMASTLHTGVRRGITSTVFALVARVKSSCCKSLKRHRQHTGGTWAPLCSRLPTPPTSWPSPPPPRFPKPFLSHALTEKNATGGGERCKR